MMGDEFRQLTEVEAEDINLKSFEVKDDLEPSIWKRDGKIVRKIRTRLLDIADDFLETLATPWVKIKDVVLTGSIANYNWSKYSDIDLHIVVRFKDVWEKRTDFVKDYFNSKKEEWKTEHGDIKINGYPVEISVEDEDSPSQSTGVYSLKDDEWIREPGDIQDMTMNKDYVREKSAEYMTRIDDLIADVTKAKDPEDKMKGAKKLTAVFEKLKNLRKEGLASKSGEMSSGNIIWKVLRRAGYIDDLWDAVNKAYDISMSIKRS